MLYNGYSNNTVTLDGVRRPEDGSNDDGNVRYGITDENGGYENVRFSILSEDGCDEKNVLCGGYGTSNVHGFDLRTR